MADRRQPAATTQRLLRLVLATDQSAERRGDLWIVRCLHCRVRVQISDRDPGGLTIEHIVPSSWFGLAAGRDLTAMLSGPDDPRNLALACARCNHGKGRTHDARGPGDPRAVAVIRQLLERRRALWREAPG